MGSSRSIACAFLTPFHTRFNGNRVSQEEISSRGSHFCSLDISPLLLSRVKSRLRRKLHSVKMQATALKTSIQVGFCRRQRLFKAESDNSYAVVEDSIKISQWRANPAVVASLKSEAGKRNELRVVIIPLQNGTYRIVIEDFDEQPHERHMVKDVIMEHVLGVELDEAILRMEEGHVQINVGDRETKLNIFFDPFRIDMIDASNNILASVNADSRLMVEDFGRTNTLKDDDCGKEAFMHFIDTKPRGPESVGLDISFPSCTDIHGIPERTSAFSLPDTVSDASVLTEPYRLYNLDVSHYKLDKPLGLYGSIPFIMARKGQNAVGLFWQNSSETYMDIVSKDENKSTHWYSESGAIDLFLLPGATPAAVSQQYLWLTGRPPLPALFAVGYHQCRYSYMSDADVREVDEGFSSRDIPYDVMWLDIDYTDGKRYFTWNNETFPDPTKLQNDLAKNGRKTVIIIDPHIKVDEDYNVYNLGTSQDVYVTAAKGEPFVGKCWPGESSFIDFLSSRGREMWADLFNLKKFPGFTQHMHVWNDMNEPSVFGGPERTMQKDLLHGDIEHRHVHNMYGHSHIRATYEGLLKSRPNERAFVLTRSFFAGSQRYAAVWTGDNGADWDHLKASVGMLLSLQLCGVAMSGADVGGFFSDPDGELSTRWYQAGAFQPFFRGHSCQGTKRREPWSFGDPYTAHIRAAIRMRYEFIPYWYTVFAKFALGEKAGLGFDGPVMRPVWWEFEGWEENDSMWMVGDAILAAPIMKSNPVDHTVNLPEGRWYDLFAGWRCVRERLVVAADLSRMVVLQRGGTIVPRLHIGALRSTMDMGKEDAYTLVVGLDDNGCASGEMYIDDGKSFEFENGKLRSIGLNFKDNQLVAHTQMGDYVSAARIDRIVICGYDGGVPSSVAVDGKPLAFDLQQDNVLLLNHVNQPLCSPGWTLTISDL